MLGSAGTWDLHSANLLAALPGSAGCHMSLPYPPPRELGKTPSSPAPCHHSAAKRMRVATLSETWGFLHGHHGTKGGRPVTVSGSTAFWSVAGTRGQSLSRTAQQRAAWRRAIRATTGWGGGLAAVHPSTTPWPPGPLTHPTPHPFSSPAPITHPPTSYRPPHLPSALSSPPPARCLHLQAASLIAF